MNGASAPPPPFSNEFAKTAAAFGIQPAQLKQILAADPGMLEQMQKAFEHRHMQQAQSMNAAMQSQAPQGYGQMQAGLGQQAAQNAFNMQMPLQPQPMTLAEVQAESVAKMNPIAREKYEPIFKLLEIRVRYANNPTGGTAWVIQKAGKSGKQYRQEWSAPGDDPGCSLAVWDALVGELLDFIKRDEDGTSPDNNGSAVAGHQAGRRAGAP